ncbi:MAG: RNA methyltransferase [Burkholderiaceae bacterium]
MNSRFERNTPRPLHQPDPPELARIVFVLVGTSHPGNVGSTARAMRNMGVSRLRLVAPRFADIASQPEALAFASGADALLQDTSVHAELADALADCALAVAVSAEPREFSAQPQTPEVACALAVERLKAHPEHRVAFVFGAERTGLTIAQMAHCAALLSIPGHPQYNSLNLAQAVQVVAYVLRQQALLRSGSVEAAADGDDQSRLADQAAVQGLIEHLEQTLLAVGFLDPARPRKLMPRLVRFIHRAQPTSEEVDLLRGICKAVLRQRGLGYTEPPTD